jgi:hypothetical protein
MWGCRCNLQFHLKSVSPKLGVTKVERHLVAEGLDVYPESHSAKLAGRKIHHHDRLAAMWAAANPEQFEQCSVTRYGPFSELLKTPHFMPKKGVLAIGVPDPPKVGTTGSMISMT